MGGYSGWGGGGKDDEQDEGLTSTLVYGSGKNEGNEAQPAAAPESLPGPQPSAGNFSTGEGYSGTGMVRGRTSQPTPPTYNPSPLPTPPDRQLGREQALDQSIAKYGTPINRQDASVKPKWYERVAGGLAGGLIGVRNPGEGIQAGSSIVNRRYNQAEQARQTNLGTAERQMGDFRAERQDANQAFEQQMQVHNAGTQDYNSSERAYQGQVMANDRAAQEQQRLQKIAPGTEAPDDPNNKMGGWHATTIGGQQLKLNSPPDSWLNSSEGKMAQETTRRQGLIRDNHLKGDDAKFVSVNGKLKEPAPTTNVHIPSAEAEKYHDMKAAFHKENGRDPNLSELQSIMQGEHARGSMKKSDSDAIIAARNTAFQKAQDAYKKATASAMTPDEKQEAENDYLDAAETVQRGFEDRIKSKTGNDIEPFDIRSALSQSLHGKSGSAPAQPQAQPQAQAAPQQAAPAQAPQAKRFNPAKWKAANPQGDVNAAIKAAQAQHYTIVGQ
jgi:hypothetical protein